MNDTPQGIHHVTAIAGDAQRNLDFYAGVLGLRLVKRTVNFDDPGTYHLYYGDEQGRPGTIMTFFPWKGAPRGSIGSGQTVATSFSVPTGSLAYWHDRLRNAELPVESPRTRFDEEVLAFADPDGLRLELVAHAEASDLAPWQDGGMAAAYAIRAFRGVTLAERSLQGTAEVLTGSFGFQDAGAVGDRHRFVAPAGGPASIVDVVVVPDEGPGRIAVGSVHHVAFRIAGSAEQEHWRLAALDSGLHVTTARDRKYFRSMYFREPGGVLFEVATDPPGFVVDEGVAELGCALRLPEWLEPERAVIEGKLPELMVPSIQAVAS